MQRENKIGSRSSNQSECMHARGDNAHFHLPFDVKKIDRAFLCARLSRKTEIESLADCKIEWHLQRKHALQRGFSAPCGYALCASEEIKKKQRAPAFNPHTPVA
jgi:hypothetical protein